MKIALYARVSTQGQNLDNQKLELVEYAKRQGWNYQYFEEKESTRKTRPVKYNLLQELRKGKFDGVCIVKLDRWARSTIELTTEVQELFDKNIKFISLRDNIDFSTASGRLQFAMFAAMAQFERDVTRERVLSGLKRAELEGRKGGRPKGKKDSTPRRKSGYYMRWERKKN